MARCRIRVRYLQVRSVIACLRRLAHGEHDGSDWRHGDHLGAIIALWRVHDGLENMCLQQQSFQRFNLWKLLKDKNQQFENQNWLCFQLDFPFNFLIIQTLENLNFAAWLQP